MTKSFLSEAIKPRRGCFDPAVMSCGELALPPAFYWRGKELVVVNVLRTWRSSKVDRGDSYVDRHWFEVELQSSGRAVIYFDRHFRRSKPAWWIYTLEE